MAPEPEIDSNALPKNPLMEAEAAQYVENQKRADFYRNISQYLFWGATTILGGLAFSIIGGGALALSTPMLFLGAAASVATFIGSVAASRKSVEITEQGNVLYSDIDSRQQSHRMVQAFAKAQVQAKSQTDEIPFAGPDQKNWTAGMGERSAPAAQNQGWAEYVATRADREDAQQLAGLQGH